MSKELKDETLKALKVGVDFLEKVKVNLACNELRNKLDEVYSIFQELVKKWDGNCTKMETEVKWNKNILNKSTPVPPILKKPLAERKTFPLNTISENTGKETKPCIKEKRSLFQQMRRNSRSNENLAEEKVNKRGKKILYAQDIVRVHIPTTQVNAKETYLRLQEADSDLKMWSDTKKFRKIAKIKLKVNDKAIGGRMCCLQDTNMLLGRELNDQVAEYGLNLKEYYRLTNLKSLYFELSKREAVYSFRFEKESECLDWYNTIDEIIESQGMYSYVSVPAGGKSNAPEVAPLRNKFKTTESAMSRVDCNHDYDYPEVPKRKPKPRANTAFDVIDDPNSVYSYTNSFTSTLRNSMATEWYENGIQDLPRTKNVLTRDKPNLSRGRSMST